MIKSKFSWQNINQTPYRNPNIFLNKKKQIIDNDVSDLENLTPTIAIGDKGFLISSMDCSKITISILNSEELFLNDMTVLDLHYSDTGFSNGIYGYIFKNNTIYKFLISNESSEFLINDLNIMIDCHSCSSNDYVGLIYNTNNTSFFISYYLFSNNSKKNNIYDYHLSEMEDYLITANHMYCIVLHELDQIQSTSYFNIMTVGEKLFFADCIGIFYMQTACSNETYFLTFNTNQNNHMYIGTYASKNIINFFGNITETTTACTTVNNDYRAVCVQKDYYNKFLNYVEFSTKSNTTSFGYLNMAIEENRIIGFSGI